MPLVREPFASPGGQRFFHLGDLPTPKVGRGAQAIAILGRAWLKAMDRHIPGVYKIHENPVKMMYIWLVVWLPSILFSHILGF